MNGGALEKGKAGRLLLAAFLLTFMMPSYGADYRKMSAHVRSIMSRQASHVVPFTRSRATAASSQSLMALVSINADEADDVWRQHGCKSYAQLGDIAIVSIPLNRLGQLSDHRAVRRIEANPSAHLTMDTTAIVVNATKLYPPQTANTHPFTGQGVVVGVMDIGFDLTHPNFYDTTATNYRIGAFWDQLSRDTVGSSFPVGRDFCGYDSVSAQLHSYDGLSQTHGTHTLGIAAGSGYDSPYRGIAYDADICIVNNAVSNNAELIDSADIYKYTTAVDALGFKYIFDYADRQGKPCVASFSEGYTPYLDEEDSLFAAVLGQLTGPGRIIVASAGNESTANTYIEKPCGQADAGAFIGAVHPTAIYHIKSDGPADVVVYGYGDDTATPTDTVRLASAIFSQDSLLIDTLYVGSDTCAVAIERYPSSLVADTMYTLVLHASKPLNQLPPIAIVVLGTDSHIQLYGSSSYPLTNATTDTRWNSATKGHNIHAPACFPSVISVGATAHRLGFTNYKGQYRDFSSGRTAGRLSPYSSVGPALDGTQKPEVVAPGDNVISSYSSYYIEANPEASDINSDVSHFDFRGRTYAWNANTGTSMATPVVAGVIALWLQACPQLTPADIVDALSHSCRQPDTALSYPNYQYGYGEIDAYRGLLYLTGADHIEGLSDHQPDQLRISVDGHQLSLHTATPLATPLHLSIYSLDGRRVHQTIVTTSVLPLPTLPSGLYVVQIDSAFPHLTGSQLVRL